MSSTPKQSKLKELRVKTNQGLVRVISNELERCLRFALRAEGTKSRSEVDLAERPRVKAENAYAEALKLLPKVEDMRERRRLQRKLTRLREAMDRLPANEPRVKAAYS